MARITVLHSPGPRDVGERELDLAPGATVGDVLAACGLQVPEGGEVGIWGRRTPLSHVLREGDRVEVCRPLVVDPKVARRERFQRQGARATGLFANRRPGAKQGY
jgi:putative ubiquitin-RnfH superfamily antitoxin RatB of RatAB toxin-antitoxin module